MIGVTLSIKDLVCCGFIFMLHRLVEICSGKILLLHINSNINDFYLMFTLLIVLYFLLCFCPLKVRRDRGCTKEIAVLVVDCPGKALGCEWKDLLLLYEVSIGCLQVYLFLSVCILVISILVYL